MESHHIHPELLKHKVRMLVVGSGVNGSAIAAGLPYLHQREPTSPCSIQTHDALRALGRRRVDLRADGNSLDVMF